MIRHTTMLAAIWVAMLAVTPADAAGPRTGSWGDQGDGTYRNPILNADYPDVDVEQRGDTYHRYLPRRKRL